VTQENLPAIPETSVQQARYDRVIAAATEVLSAGGQEAVQMKDLAQRAGVSLATLYRYFPAKDYVLLAVALSRYQSAWRRVSAEVPRGYTVRDRAFAHLMREFRAEQRDKRLTAALAAALQECGRLAGKRVAVVQSGGNIDRALFAEVLAEEDAAVVP